MKDSSSRSQPVLSPESDNAGVWIEWNGGACPIPDNWPVQVKFRLGRTDGLCRAKDWDWEWDRRECTDMYDIIAYRANGGEAVHEQVSQPIRDEPIPFSLTDEMVEALDNIADNLRVISNDMAEAGISESLWRGVYQQAVALEAAMDVRGETK